jgi:oxygen-independent coproporphyrinogen-3 oxidase
MVEKAHSPVVRIEEINAASEFVFLGLRLTKGVDLPAYKNRFGIDLRVRYAGELQRLEEFGLIAFNENCLKLTKKGFLYSNEVFSIFV